MTDSTLLQRQYPRRAIAVVALGAACIAVSCGTPPRVDTAAPPPLAAAAPTSEPLPVPFASTVELTDAQAAALHGAVETAIADCMASAGFRYDPQPYEPDTAPPPLFGNLNYAETSGYGIVANLNSPLPPTDNGHPLAWRQALIGTATFDQLSSDAALVPDTGGMRVAIDPNSCASKARSAVYGDDLTWQQAKARITYLQNLAYTEAIGDGASTDPTWAQGLDAWQRCMSAHDYGLPAPLAAIPTLAARAQVAGTDLAALRSEEIATAAADATCVQQTGLGLLARQRLRDVEVALSDANPEPLAAYSELLRGALERADAGPN